MPWCTTYNYFCEHTCKGNVITRHRRNSWFTHYLSIHFYSHHVSTVMLTWVSTTYWNVKYCGCKESQIFAKDERKNKVNFPYIFDVPSELQWKAIIKCRLIDWYRTHILFYLRLAVGHIKPNKQGIWITVDMGSVYFNS